ncbi:MAG: enoyl-CoA hydratase-related protein [Thermoplasmata archaeon]
MPISNLRAPAFVAVLGGGNMGSGIAQACAQAGFSVRVRDLDAAILARGQSSIEKTLQGGIERKKLTTSRRDEILGRIAFTTELAAAVDGAALVIEAVFEDEAVKTALFTEVARVAGPDAIVATNTSSLSVTKLQQNFPRPSRFAGLHFFWPAALNKLLEVIAGDQTDPSVVRVLEQFGYALRKIPIQVRDSPGFAVNRFFVPYLNEAARMAGESVANLRTIEEVGRELFETSLGPFELMNVTGIPIALHSETTLATAFGGPYTVAPLLESQFRSGQPWGWKSAELEPDRKAAVRDRFLGLVIGIATRLAEEGVASPEAIDRGAVVGLKWRRGPFALLSGIGLSEGLAQVEAYARAWGPSFPISQELRDRVTRKEERWPLNLVRVDRHGPVAWVLLDRPEVLNSLNSELLEQIEATFHSLLHDAELRCVVLAGSAPVFAAGADIREMARKDLAEGLAFGFLGQRVARVIAEFPRPVLALVEGFALGGGLEIALAADLIVAAEGAQLGLPEVTVGIHPGMGGASRLTRRIGPAKTKLLVYSGIPVSAEEAHRLGFVERIYPAATAREETERLAQTIASRAPLGVQWIKRVIDQGLDAPLATALHLEGESAGHTFGTADRTEGMQAFLERRPPKFAGK